MTQYLIRTIEHKGETFTDVITVRDNETYQVVEAESKEEAEMKASNRSLTNKALEESINEINQRLMERSVLSKRQRKKWYRKHSRGLQKTEIEKADPTKWLDNFTKK